MLTRLTDAVLDATIVYSFDASGYRRHARRFAPADLDVDMTGKVCLVTGANGGIGKELARGLAQRGADVYLLCRSAARGEEARREIADQTGRPVHLVQLDVSDLAAVREFAKSFEPKRIDVLIHNAGLIPSERALTSDGLETTLAVHVIGPFLLSRLLEPKLRAASPGRVLFISSGGMYTNSLSLNDLDWSQRKYDGVAAYAQTKRMQVVLTELLAKDWAGKGIVCHSMHPGWADTTGLQNSLPNFTDRMSGRLRSAAEGADTALWLAVAPEPTKSSGRFWFDRKPARTHMLPLVTRDKAEDRTALWTLCQQRSGVS